MGLCICPECIASPKTASAGRKAASQMGKTAENKRTCAVLHRFVVDG